MTENVVGAIEPSLRMAEIERSKRKLPGDMEAYDLYLRALPELHSMRPERSRQALDYLHQAIELDPGYALALAHLGRMEGTRAAVEKLLELAPNLTVSGLRERWPLRNKEKLEMILDGLQRAGLPD